MTAQYSLVDLEITGHQRDGLVVRTADGADGFVDRADISDTPIPRADWPAIGSTAAGVVLGVTRAGKLRVSLRPGEVGLVTAALELVTGVDHTREAVTAWARVRDHDFADDAARNEFLAASRAAASLREALRQRGPSLSDARNHQRPG